MDRASPIDHGMDQEDVMAVFDWFMLGGVTFSSGAVLGLIAVLAWSLVIGRPFDGS